MLVFRRCLNCNGLQSHIAGTGSVFCNIGLDGCSTAVFHHQVLIRSGDTAVSRLQLPDYAVNNDIAVQAGIALIDIDVGILFDHLFTCCVQEDDLLCLNVQRFGLCADGACAPGCNHSCLLPCRNIGCFGIGVAVEQRAVGVVYTDLHILSCRDVHDLVRGSILSCHNALGGLNPLQNHRAVGARGDIAHLIAAELREPIVGGQFAFCVILLEDGQCNSLAVCRVAYGDDAVCNTDIVLTDGRPAGVAIRRVIEGASVSRVPDSIDILCDVIRQPLQHDGLARQNLNVGAACVDRRRNHVQDSHGFGLCHPGLRSLTVEHAVHQLVNIAGFLIQIDSFSVDIDIGIGALHSQSTQVRCDQLCGSVDTAVKLGFKAAGNIDNQTALGQIQGIGDLVAVCLTSHGKLLGRNLHRLENDVGNLTGEDGMNTIFLWAAEAENQDLLRGAVPVGIHEAFFGFGQIFLRGIIAILDHVLHRGVGVASCLGGQTGDTLLKLLCIVNQLVCAVSVDNFKGCSAVHSNRAGFAYHSCCGKRTGLNLDIFVSLHKHLMSVFAGQRFFHGYLCIVNLFKAGLIQIDIAGFGFGEGNTSVRHIQPMGDAISLIVCLPVIVYLQWLQDICHTIVQLICVVKCVTGGVLVDREGLNLLDDHCSGTSSCLLVHRFFTGRLVQLRGGVVGCRVVDLLLAFGNNGFIQLLLGHEGNVVTIHLDIQKILHRCITADKVVSVVLNGAVRLQNAITVVLGAVGIRIDNAAFQSFEASLSIVGFTELVSNAILQQRAAALRIHMVGDFFIQEHMVSIFVLIDRLTILRNLVNVLAAYRGVTDTAVLALVGDGGGNLRQLKVLEGYGLGLCLELVGVPGILDILYAVGRFSEAEEVTRSVALQPDLRVSHLDTGLHLGGVGFTPEDIVQLGQSAVHDGLAENRVLNIQLCTIVIVVEPIILVFDGYLIAGAQEVGVHELIACKISGVIQMLNTVIGVSVATKCRSLALLVTVVTVVGFHLVAFDHQVLEGLKVCDAALTCTLHLIELHRLGSRIMLDDVVDSTGGIIHHTVHRGIQAIQEIILLVTDVHVRLNELGFPFLNSSIHFSGKANRHAVEQIHILQPVAGNRLGQNLEGGVVLYGQQALFQINGNAIGQLDLHQLLVFIDELVVTHIGGNSVLLNSGHIAINIRVDQGAVGQLVDHQILCRVVSSQVVLQHIHAFQLVFAGQHNYIAVALNIIQGAGDRNGNGGGALHPEDVSALLQVQADTAFAGLNAAQVNIDVGAGSRFAAAYRIDPLDQCAGNVHEDITGGRCIHRAGRALEHPYREGILAAANGACTADLQGVHPQGADSAVRCNHRCMGQVAAHRTGPADLCRSVIDRDQTSQPDIGIRGGGYHESGKIAGVVGGNALSLAVYKHTGIDETGVDIGHALQDDALGRAVGNGQGGNHALIVHNHAGNGGIAIAVIAHISVAGQGVGDVAEGDTVAGLGPDDRLVADAHLAHAASVGDINVDTRSRVAQIQGKAVDGNTAVVGETGILILGVLVDKAAGVLLIQNAVFTELTIVNPKIGALVGKVRNRNRSGFRGHNLALGKGIANGVQLDTGIGMDIGIQIFRCRGGVENGSVMSDDGNTAHRGICPKCGIQIVHGVNIRAKAAALCVAIAVDIQLVEDGVNIDISALNFLRHILNGHAGIQGNGCDILHIRCYAQAGAVCGGIGVYAVLRSIASDIHGTEAVGDLADTVDCYLGGIAQGQFCTNRTQSNHTAGTDLRIGVDAVILTNIAGDVEITEVCRKITVFANGDGAAADQFIDRLNRTLLEEAAAVCHGSGLHQSIGNGGDSQRTFRMNLRTNINIIGGGNLVFTHGVVRIHGKANAAARGVTFCLGQFLRPDGDILVGSQLRLAIDIGLGVIPALGRQLGFLDAESRYGHALLDNSLGKAGVIGSDKDIIPGMDSAAVDTGDNGLLLIQAFCADGCRRAGNRCAGKSAAACTPCLGIGRRVADGFHRNAAGYIHVGSGKLGFHSIAGGGGSEHSAQRNCRNRGRHPAGCLRLGERFCVCGEAAAHCQQIAGYSGHCQQVFGCGLCRCLVDRCTSQIEIHTSCGAGFCNGLAVGIIADNLGKDIHAAAYLQLSAIGEAGILLGRQIGIGHIHCQLQAFHRNLYSPAQCLRTGTAKVPQADAAGYNAAVVDANGCIGHRIGIRGCYIAFRTVQTDADAACCAGFRMGLSIGVVFNGYGSRVQGIGLQLRAEAAGSIGCGHQNRCVVHAEGHCAVVHICLGIRLAVHGNRNRADGGKRIGMDESLCLGIHGCGGRGGLDAKQGDCGAAAGRAAAHHCVCPGGIVIVEIGFNRDIPLGTTDGRSRCVGTDVCDMLRSYLSGDHIGRDIYATCGDLRCCNGCICISNAVRQDSYVILRDDLAVAFYTGAGRAAGLRIGRVDRAFHQAGRDSIFGLSAHRIGTGLIPVLQSDSLGGNLLSAGGVQIRLGAAAGEGIHRGNRAGVVAQAAATVNTGIREGAGICRNAEGAIDGSGDIGHHSLICRIEACYTDICSCLHMGHCDGSIGGCTDSRNCTQEVRALAAGAGILVQIGGDDHICALGIQCAVTDKGILPHLVHRNGYICDDIDCADRDIGQFGCFGRNDICLCQRCTHCRNADVALCRNLAVSADACIRTGGGVSSCGIQADILIGDDAACCRSDFGIRDGGIGVADGDAAAFHIPVGLHNGLEGAGCEAVAQHDTHGIEGYRQIVNLRICGRGRSIADCHIASLTGKAGYRAAGGIRQSHSPVSGNCKHTGGCGVDAGFCHIFKCDFHTLFHTLFLSVLFHLTLLMGNQILGGYSRQYGFHRQSFFDIQHGVGIHVGLLLRSNPGKGQRSVARHSANGRIDHQRMSLCAAVSQYFSTVCAHCSGGTQNLSIVYSFIEGQSQIDTNSIFTACTGNRVDLAIAVVWLFFRACLDGNTAVSCDLRTGKIQNCLVGGAEIGHIHSSTHSSRTAHNAGGDHSDIAVIVCLYRDIACGNNIHAADCCNIGDEAQAHGHNAVDGNCTACGTCAGHGGLTLGICGNLNFLYGDAAGNRIDGHFAAVADIGFGVQLVNHHHNGCTHSHSTAANGDDVAVSIGIKVMLNLHNRIGSIDDNIFSDKAAGTGVVRRQGYACVDAHRACCQTSYSNGSIGFSSSFHSQLGQVIAGDSGIADDGGLCLALEVGCCQRNIDSSYAGCDAGIHSEHITIIHIGLDSQGLGLFHIARQNCLGGGEHGHDRTADRNTCSTAAHGDGDQTHGVLSIGGNALLLQLAVGAPGRTEIFDFLDFLFRLDGSACTCHNGNISVCLQGGTPGNQSLNIGVQNGCRETNAHACSAADGNRTRDDIGVQGIGCQNLNIACCGNESTGRNIRRDCIGQVGDGLCCQLVVLSSLLIQGRIEGIRAGQVSLNIFVLLTVVEVALGALVLPGCLFVCDCHILAVFLDIELAVALDGGSILAGLTILAVILSAGLLVVPFQERIQRNTGLIPLGRAVRFVKCAVKLGLGIQSSVRIEDIVGILAQHIACHHSGQGSAHSRARTHNGSGNAEHIPDGAGLKCYIVGMDIAVAKHCANGIEADIDQSGNTHTGCAGSGDGGDNCAEGIIILSFHSQVANRVDINIGAGVSLGLDLRDNQIQSAAHGYTATAGNTDCIRIHCLQGVGQNGYIAANFAGISTGTGSIPEIGSGLVLEAGNHGHRRNSCGSGACGCHRDMKHSAVGCCMDIQVTACLQTAAQSCCGLIVKDQSTHIACHTCGAGDSKGNSQQVKIIVGQGRCLDAAACQHLSVHIHTCLHSLIIDHGHNRSAYTHFAGSRNGACKVVYVCLVGAFYGNLRIITGFYQRSFRSSLPRIARGNVAACAYRGLDGVFQHHRVHNTGNTHIPRISADGCHQHLSKCICAENHAFASFCTVGKLHAIAISTGIQGYIVSDGGENLILHHHGGNGCTRTCCIAAQSHAACCVVKTKLCIAGNDNAAASTNHTSGTNSGLDRGPGDHNGNGSFHGTA